MFFSPEYLIISCSLLWFFALIGLHFTRNFIIVLISFEFMFLSICILFCVFAFETHTLYGHIFSLFVLGVVAAESAIGLALYAMFYTKTINAYSDNIID